MKHRLFHAFAIVTGALLALAVGPAIANAVGPYYATPSWDQTLPAATRFVVLSNFASAAVLDRETGLVWERSPSNGTTANTFAQAQDYCARLGSFGSLGRMGWRLPTAAELSSLTDPSQNNPALPSGHPFQNIQITIGSSFYWTVTTDARFPGNAYEVDFRFAEVVSDFQTAGALVWCVRGGQAGASQ
jgi:hypothetical protein